MGGGAQYRKNGGGSIRNAIKNPLTSINKPWGDLSTKEKYQMIVGLYKAAWEYKKWIAIVSDDKGTRISTDSSEFANAIDTLESPDGYTTIKWVAGLYYGGTLEGYLEGRKDVFELKGLDYNWKRIKNGEISLG